MPGERETARLRLEVDAGGAAALNAWARARRSSLFGLLLTLYFQALHTLTEREDVTVASLFANRLRPDLQSTVGFMANLVTLRSRWRAGDTFASLHESVRAELTDGCEQVRGMQPHPEHRARAHERDDPRGGARVISQRGPQDGDCSEHEPRENEVREPRTRQDM